MSRSSKEEGSTVLVLVVAAAALGFTSYFVQGIEQHSRNAIRNVRKQANDENSEILLMNTLARFRALSAERRDESGRHIPGLFAGNYFSSDWDIQANPALVLKDVALEKGGIKIGAGSPENQSAGDFQIKILKVNFDEETRIAESLDVAASGTFARTSGQSTTVKRNARIKLIPPLPRDPKLQYRKKGDGIWLDDLGKITQGGSYEFRVLASGVVFGAMLKINDDTHVLGGFGTDGKISHAATSYKSVDVPIGSPVLAELGTSPAAESSSSLNGSFDEAKCVFVPASGSGSGSPTMGNYTIQAILEGVDKKNLVATAPVVISLSSSTGTTAIGTKKLTEADYRNFCSDQCLFLENDPNADIIAERAEKKVKGDMSSAWTLDEAKWFKVESRKLCINFDKVGSSNFDASEMYVYDIPSCHRNLLFKRGKCGCVAEDSLILLGDGRAQKRIADISDKDRIWNPLIQSSVGIRKITRGPELDKPMLLLRFSDRELRVTGQHPFPTNAGERRAYELKVGDVLIGESGRHEVIEAIETVWPNDATNAPVVWNLELDAPDDDWEAHHMVVNGIVTGDLLLQVKAEQSR